MRKAKQLIRIALLCLLVLVLFSCGMSGVSGVINVTPFGSQLLSLQFKLGYRDQENRTRAKRNTKIMCLFIQMPNIGFLVLKLRTVFRVAHI